MLPLLVIFLVLALVVGGGIPLIKRGRKAQQEKIQAQLDIALGKFDATPANEAPAPARRKAAPLSKPQRDNCRVLQTEVREYMELLHRYENVQTPVCIAAYSAVKKLEKDQPLQLKSYSKHAIRQFFESSIAHWCEWAVAADEKEHSDSLAQALAGRLVHQRRVVDKARRRLLDSAPENHPEVSPIAGVAARVYDRPVVGYRPFNGSTDIFSDTAIEAYLGSSRSKPAERTVHSADEVRKLIEEDLTDLNELLPDVYEAAANLHDQLVQCEKRWTAFERAANKTLPYAPAKPTAQLVEKFLEEMQTWAETLYASISAYTSTVATLHERRTHFESCFNRLENHALKVNTRNPIVHARYALKEAFEEMTTAAAAWSEEHRLIHHLLKTISLDPELTVWAFTRLGNEPTTEDLKAGVRKLAFALAQERATSARLYQTQVQDLPEVVPPGLELPSAAAFVHEYRQWKQACDRHEQKKTARDERIASLQKQVPERQNQSKAAAYALLTACKTLQTSTSIFESEIQTDRELGTAWLKSLAAGFAAVSN